MYVQREVARTLPVGCHVMIDPRFTLHAYDPLLRWEAVHDDPWPLLTPLASALGATPLPSQPGQALARVRDTLAVTGELPPIDGWVLDRRPDRRAGAAPGPPCRPWTEALPRATDAPRVQARKCAVMLLAIACQAPPLVLWRRAPDPDRWRTTPCLILHLVTPVASSAVPEVADDA